LAEPLSAPRKSNSKNRKTLKLSKFFNFFASFDFRNMSQHAAATVQSEEIAFAEVLKPFLGRGDPQSSASDRRLVANFGLRLAEIALLWLRLVEHGCDVRDRRDRRRAGGATFRPPNSSDWRYMIE
jgi:hypothetical protein